jgi:predicted NBD/HSP70 family sugar kinase
MITAVDVGGTKTSVGQFGDAMQLINQSRFPTPEDPDVFFTELKRSLNQLKEVTAIVMAVPGEVVEGVIIDCANLPLWRNLSPVAELQKTFKCPVLIENDASLAGLAEINALSPIPKMGLYLTVSTGIGSGVIVDGQLNSALSRSEMGHMVFLADGKWQIWEHFASGKALARHFNKMASEFDRPEEWQWTAEKLAVGLGAVIPALRPEVIVFGGGVGAYFEKFAKPLEELLRERLTSLKFLTIPKMTMARHPTEAVLYGCYYYATHNQDSQ